jgi:hypothetical protein
MKKSKEVKVPINCKSCRSSLVVDEVCYCKLRLKDENCLLDSGIVTTVIDCIWFKVKK